jgi:ammonium transporter, Amt family
MKPYLKISTSVVAGFALCVMVVPAVSAAETAITLNMPDQSLALLALAFLAPIGFALLAAATGPAERVPDVALAALLALGLSCVTYFACGFAFQFGGLGLWHPDPAYESLNVYWSAFGSDYGRGWGMLGLRGFGLSDGVGTPAAFRLFLAQLPLVTTATMIPLLALRRRVNAVISLLAGLLVALLIYPALGNWMWGGGWLSQLGANLDLGHGALDMGGAGPVHLAGGALALVAIVVFLPRRQVSDARSAPIPLPDAHLPVLGILGALLLVVGWWGVILVQPLPDWSTLSTELTGMNLMLAAAAAALLPGLYTWFAAGRPDPIMVARGLAAGVIAVSAGAPFMATWSALLVGSIAGVLVPISTYVILEKLRLDDSGGMIAMHGVGGIIGLLAPAFFATGLYGAGWNMVGRADYLGVVDQGVTGLLAAAGRQPDWPGQLTAQASAVGASIIFPGLLAFILFQAVHRLIRAWQPIGPESPEPAVLQEEAASTGEDTPTGEDTSMDEGAPEPNVESSDEVECSQEQEIDTGSIPDNSVTPDEAESPEIVEEVTEDDSTTSTDEVVAES